MGLKTQVMTETLYPHEIYIEELNTISSGKLEAQML